MEQSCHRCGGTLIGSDPFCPHCGAPQLRYEPSDEAVSSIGNVPAQRTGSRGLNSVSWPDAILAAALLAIPAGLLSSLLGLEALWVIAAAMAAITLYRRRTHSMPSSSMGWRIGGLLGIFAAAVAGAIDGITLLIQRYGLHQGLSLDQRYRDLGQQLTDQLIRSNPDAASVIPGFLHFWITPDGAAAMVLLNAAGLVASTLLFAAIGGALGARLSQKIAQPSAR
jgi:hypothetical protein